MFSIRSEVLTAVSIKIWSMMPCFGRWEPNFQWNMLPLSSGFRDPYVGGGRFLWNFGTCLPSYVASHPRRP